MSLLTSGRLARLQLFPFTCRGHLVGYFEDSPGNRYRVSTASCNSAGEWHEFYLLHDSVAEAAESVAELVDYRRTVERMERELGRRLTIDELPKEADPRDRPGTPDALQPCPFCGGPAEAVDAAGDHTVGCANGNACEVYAVAGPYPTPAEAAQAWNRRAVR